MTDQWKQVKEDEQDDDLIGMNGAGCDHPCCPEHGDGPEDSQPNHDTDKLVRDLWRFIEDVSDYDPGRTDKFFQLRDRVRCYYAGIGRMAVEPRS